MPRRVPQRRPQTIPLGARMTVRQRIDDQTYELYGGSRFGSPEIGFFSGSRALLPGEPVRATWREESRIWEITGIDRSSSISEATVIAIGFDDSPFFGIHEVDSSGLVIDGATGPADIPSAKGYELEFSPDGQFLAVLYSDKLAVYAFASGAIGALIDTITLPDVAPSSWHPGLSWHRDSNLIAATFDNNPGAKTFGVYGWDGTTLTELALGDEAAAFSSGTAAAWHPVTDHLAIGQTTSTVGLRIYSWNGSTLTLEDSADLGGSSGQGVLDLQWNAAGDQILVGANATSDPKVVVVPWDGAALGTPIEPSAQPDGTVRSVAFYPDESKIVVATEAGSGKQLAGYTWDGATFGTLVQTGGGNASGWRVRVDPAGAFCIIVQSIDGGDYGTSYTFDGSTIAIVSTFGAVDELAGGRAGLAFPPAGVVGPTEVVDATDVTYTPAVGGDWATEPDDVAEALDALAASIPLTGSVELVLGGFAITTGSPAKNTGNQWAFDAAADEEITGYFVIPQDYGSGGLFRFHYLMTSATSGTAEWEATVLPTIEGEDTSAAGAAASVADTVQGTAVNQGTVDVTPTQTYVAGDVARVKLGRLGTSDSAAGDALLIAVEFVYTPVGAS